MHGINNPTLMAVSNKTLRAVENDYPRMDDIIGMETEKETCKRV